MWDVEYIVSWKHPLEAERSDDVVVYVSEYEDGFSATSASLGVGKTYSTAINAIVLGLLAPNSCGSAVINGEYVGSESDIDEERR